jgi:hypothetical protein
MDLLFSLSLPPTVRNPMRSSFQAALIEHKDVRLVVCFGCHRYDLADGVPATLIRLPLRPPHTNTTTSSSSRNSGDGLPLAPVSLAGARMALAAFPNAAADCLPVLGGVRSVGVHVWCHLSVQVSPGDTPGDTPVTLAHLELLPHPLDDRRPGEGACRVLLQEIDFLGFG